MASQFRSENWAKTGKIIIGFAGIVVMENDHSFASNIVAEAVDRDINYFDVAPTVWQCARTSAQRSNLTAKMFSWPAKKPGPRTSSGQALDESLRLLRTDHVDLYQFHALSKMSDLDQIFGPTAQWKVRSH